MAYSSSLARALKSAGLRVPAIRRLVAERDRLLAENGHLREDLARGVGGGVKATGSLCEVMNPARYRDPEWLALHRDLERYSIDKHCFLSSGGQIYRKGWEWTHCLYGLNKLGMLQPNHRAVGVGAGREPVIYYLSDHIAHVTATDLYGEGAWASEGGREADVALLERSQVACPATVDHAKISFLSRDGTKLGFADDSFDFAWSLSSIEHFGGHAAACRALQEMRRVVRPGGIVAVATELLMLDEYSHDEFFTRGEIMSDLVDQCSNLELVDPINFDTLPVEYLIDSIALPAGVHRLRRHVVLNDGNVQWTSIMLFLRKTHS